MEDLKKQHNKALQSRTLEHERAIETLRADTDDRIKQVRLGVKPNFWLHAICACTE